LKEHILKRKIDLYTWLDHQGRIFTKKTNTQHSLHKKQSVKHFGRITTTAQIASTQATHLRLIGCHGLWEWRTTTLKHPHFQFPESEVTAQTTVITLNLANPPSRSLLHCCGLATRCSCISPRITIPSVLTKAERERRDNFILPVLES